MVVAIAIITTTTTFVVSGQPEQTRALLNQRKLRIRIIIIVAVIFVQATGLFNQMKLMRVEPTEVTHTAYINVCAARCRTLVEMDRHAPRMKEHLVAAMRSERAADRHTPSPSAPPEEAGVTRGGDNADDPSL